MSSLLNDLSISQNGGVTTITRNVQSADGDNFNAVRPRFDEVDGSKTLTVGPSHPMYDIPTTMNYSTAQDPDFSPSDGFVTKQGTPQGDMTDTNNTLYRHLGVEMPVETAMRMGLVKKSNNGYEETAKATEAAAANKTKAKAAETNGSNKARAMIADTAARSAGLARLESAIGTSALVTLIHSSVAAASHGGGLKDPSTLESAARAAGMSTGDVQTIIINAFQGSEIRAKAALDKAGISGEKAFQHLYENVDPGARASILSGLIAGDPAALNYMANLMRTGDKK